MTIKEFLEAVREFTDYAAETQSGTGWMFSHGVSGPVLAFRAGIRQQHKVYCPFHAVLEGWNEVHDDEGWVRKPSRSEIVEGLELSEKAYVLLMQAIYAVTDAAGKPMFNKKLRRDLIEACGLTDQAEAAEVDFRKRRALAKKGGA